MIYPNDVFSTQLGISIQTMVHHGMQVVLGVYVSVYNRNKYLGNIKGVVKPKVIKQENIRPIYNERYTINANVGDKKYSREFYLKVDKKLPNFLSYEQMRQIIDSIDENTFLVIIFYLP